jgi:ABC-type dipeptide/oligopeptide/nickel transport system permease subunit
MAEIGIDLAHLQQEPDPAEERVRTHGVAFRLFRTKSSKLAFGVLLFVAAVAVISLFWTPYSYSIQGTARPYSGPSPTHLFGVDKAGRDILSRLMVGARTSIIVAGGSQLLAVPFGVLLGFLAGYRGGRSDAAATTTINVFYGVPGILVAMLLVVLWGPGIDKIILAIAVTSWMDIARLARGQMLSLKERSFVDAAHAVGVGGTRIVVRHILPNCIGPLAVSAAFGFAAAVLTEAFLSYLGLGVAPPTPSWGSMAAEGFAAIRIAPHIVVVATIMITTTLVAVAFAGDALADAFDAAPLPALRR